MEANSFQIAHPLAALAWGPSPAEQPCRLVLLARSEPQNGALELIVLQHFAGGRSHLAAFVDCDNRVIEWLEWWVQTPHEIADAPAARCGLLSNSILDLQWQKLVAANRALAPSELVSTQWDTRAPEPLVVDVASRTVTRLVHTESKKPLVLARDDAALKTAGLAAYSASFERWFQAPSASGEAKWIPQRDLLSADGKSGVAVPESAGTGPILEFNSAAGQMLLKRHRPISLETFSDWIRSGTSAPADAPAGSPSATENDSSSPVLTIEKRALGAALVSAGQTGWMFAENAALESLYLRLALWHGIVRSAHRVSAAAGCPFFNLSAGSFRISLDPGSALVPPAWLFDVALVRPGEATPFKAGETAQFVPSGTTFESPSIERFGGWSIGSGTIRLSHVADAGDGQVRLEGFIDGQGLRDADEESLVWVQLAVDTRTISFIAPLEHEQGGGRAGTRFKAMVRGIPSNTVAQLKSALAPRRSCQYCVLRPVSPVFDVHALGKIGVRLLLAMDAGSAAEVEDDLFELAALIPRSSGVEHLRYLAETPDLSSRLQRILSPDAWNAGSAGPNRLPANLWHAVVHELMEFVAVEDAAHPDDAVGKEELAWLQPLATRMNSLQKLVVHTRGLLAGPRAAHEDIARVVHRFVSTSG